MKESGIVLVCADGDSTRAIAHALRREFGDLGVIVERPVSRFQMIKRRARTLGIRKAVGQAAFIGLVMPALRRLSRERIDQIRKEYNLRTDEIADPVRVDSINSEAARSALQRLSPKVVVVSGTRIIDSKTLGCVAAPFINMHAGITPQYRGVHGAYWALAEGRRDLVGTTIHYLDTGIDTGKIIEQVLFQTTARDNFATYPHLHTAAAIPSLLRVVRDSLQGKTITKEPLKGLTSKLRYHPTILEYLSRRLRTGVK